MDVTEESWRGRHYVVDRDRRSLKIEIIDYPMRRILISKRLFETKCLTLEVLKGFPIIERERERRSSLRNAIIVACAVYIRTILEGQQNLAFNLVSL